MLIPQIIWAWRFYIVEDILTRCAEMVSSTDHFDFNSDFLENYQSELQNFYISENLLHFSMYPQKFFSNFDVICHS